LKYLLVVFWIVPAGATFGQSAISFTAGSNQVLLPPVPPTVVFAPPAPISGVVVLPGNPAPTPPSQQQFTVRTWDNQSGPIVSWNVQIDAALFSLPHPPIPFPEPFYSVPDFETLLRLSGQPGAMNVNPVPEPGSLLLFAAAGLGLFGVGRH